jgi:hypothetical protein
LLLTCTEGITMNPSRLTAATADEHARDLRTAAARARLAARVEICHRTAVDRAVGLLHRVRPQPDPCAC